MCRILLALALTGLAGPTLVRADGLLVPTDRSLPPLALMYQRVNVAVEGQVATTTVEQAYRNSTDRDLEADYLFPLPPGASVRDFSMWVGGKRFRGHAVEADKARQTYEDIVRRLQDPGLLEYVGHDLWKMRIYPVPRLGEQKIEIRFTTVLPREGDLVSYRYPLRTGQAPRKTIGDFTMTVRLECGEPLGSIYSPSHEVAIDRKGDREAVASFERSAYSLDRDFVLYFAPRGDRLGFSFLAQRDSPGESGYFLLLLSPRVGPRRRVVPRDIVFVLDTSSSMAGEKLRQAKGTLAQALGALGPADRFGLIRFATLPTPFRAGLLTATPAHLAEATPWVEALEAEGATDIAGALQEALKLRPEGGRDRAFHVVFMTDGLPTAGLTDSSEILAMLRKRHDREARIFTFGLGDDVDSQLLDQIADTTRASSTYVRPSEDLELKASRLLARIRRPVCTDLELKVEGGAHLVEMFPPRLPDLFDGEQLQVVGRYEGQGTTTLKVSGRSGAGTTTESYQVDFPAVETGRDFIAPLWARRKVGYLLDQVRRDGESAEVKDELVRLAREYSIATPYTSLLVVPETTASSRGNPRRGPMGRRRATRPPDWRGFGGPMGGMAMGMGGMGGMRGGMGGMGPGMARGGAGLGGMGFTGMGAMNSAGTGDGPDGEENERTAAPSGASARLPGPQVHNQAVPGGSGHVSSPSGKEAIDLAQRLADLKGGERVEGSQPVRTIAGHRFRKVGASWVDEHYKPSAPMLKLLVLGEAYFRLLARHPEVKAILALGDRVTWVSPSGTSVVIDKAGRADVADAVLDRLFTGPE